MFTLFDEILLKSKEYEAAKNLLHTMLSLTPCAPGVMSVSVVTIAVSTSLSLSAPAPSHLWPRLRALRVPHPEPAPESPGTKSGDKCDNQDIVGIL